MLDLYVTRTAVLMAANLLRVPSERRSPLQFATDAGLTELWRHAAPETRRMRLLQAAWEARTAFLGDADDDAHRYAAYLAEAANAAHQRGATRREEFTDRMDPHFLLAQSLAFDVLDLDISLIAVLTLAVRVPAGWQA
ncbi:hypothetical protein ABT236_22595 [Streptomyces sp. NPDC001523]|uniref:hypothetical protein n=1 Tax=Streptomyces sp. NPDC001523 TaxID=3154383 RepID=UPI0033297968